MAQTPSETLYTHPFSPRYWREARGELSSLRQLIFAAMMVAMTRALSLIPSIPIAHTKLSFGFLARALCALVCGPVLGLVFGFAEDILGFILQPSGDFFFGYTLSTMLGVLVYALLLYRSRVTVLRLVIANILVNVLVNALIGSVWTVMMRGGAYWGWCSVSLVKNLITVLPKTALMYVLYQLLLPILQRLNLIPRQVEGAIPLFGRREKV